MPWSEVRSPDESFCDTLLVLSLSEGDERLASAPQRALPEMSFLACRPLRLDRGDEGR